MIRSKPQSADFKMVFWVGKMHSQMGITFFIHHDGVLKKIPVSDNGTYEFFGAKFSRNWLTR